MKLFLATLLLLSLLMCKSSLKTSPEINPGLELLSYQEKKDDVTLSRSEYQEKLEGFWLGACIANWTGLVTEMDKIGNIGDVKTGPFYTREDWGKPDQPSIWGEGVPSDLSATIDFVFADSIWGADDDTDIEYMYQHLLYENQTSILSAEQIRDGWLKHIKKEEENYLWVSNQRAFDLMHEGLLPPATGAPENNQEFEMIDAQLTTEIFGLLAPGRPDIALKMAQLPIQNTARKNAQWIAEFYVIMHSLAPAKSNSTSVRDHLFAIADSARQHLPEDSYSASMFDFVQEQYTTGKTWEQARDAIYQRYQVEQADGYDLTSRNMYCNACFAAGINFAASMVSLFYGEGDIIETIKIGVLCGWDSDNPTATWGGLLGFMLGKEGVEKAFDQSFPEHFNIHRTRQNFPNNGLDNFTEMAKKGVYIIDRVVQEEMQGGIDTDKNIWLIPGCKLLQN